MDVLLPDIGARALTIELAAVNTDDGILDILENLGDGVGQIDLLATHHKNLK